MKQVYCLWCGLKKLSKPSYSSVSSTAIKSKEGLNITSSKDQLNNKAQGPGGILIEFYKTILWRYGTRITYFQHFNYIVLSREFHSEMISQFISNGQTNINNEINKSLNILPSPSEGFLLLTFLCKNYTALCFGDRASGFSIIKHIKFSLDTFAIPFWHQVLSTLRTPTSFIEDENSPHINSGSSSLDPETYILQNVEPTTDSSGDSDKKSMRLVKAQNCYLRSVIVPNIDTTLAYSITDSLSIPILVIVVLFISITNVFQTEFDE
ncbi:hypothetical protein H8356DRAFT_1416926 [Neocallimastix lanati (nom. inval.)]|nr:hypothetical protein H8356DRAFT_1416926 [Neocallimastix sp. JGI-2020a]